LRVILSGAMLLGPLALSNRSTLKWYTYLALRKSFAVARWSDSVFSVFGPSSRYMLFSIGCALVAFVALLLASIRAATSRDAPDLRGPYTVGRLVFLVHGGLSPFLALGAVAHLSPTGRGRMMLGQTLAATLEVQAFVALCAAMITFAASVRGRPGASLAIVWRQSRDESSAVASAGAALVGGALGCRILAGTLARAFEGDSIAGTLEFRALAAVLCIAIPLFGLALALRFIAQAHAAQFKNFGRGALLLFVPLFATTGTAWVSSRQAEPQVDDVENVPTVPGKLSRPLPMARKEDDRDHSRAAAPVAVAGADEAVWQVKSKDTVAQVLPKGKSSPVRLNLLVRTEGGDRGATGLFARFGDARLGVLPFWYQPGTFVVPKGTRVLRRGGDLTGTYESGYAGSRLVYVADGNMTVQDLATDVGKITEALLTANKVWASQAEFEITVALTSPGEASLPTTGPGKPAPQVVASGGCVKSHEGKEFRPVDLDVAGDKRHLFVSAPFQGERESPKPLLMVLHGAGGDAAGMRAAFTFERVAEGKAVIVYPEGRAGLWDLEQPEGSNQDIAFIDAVINWAKENTCIDVHRLFITGYSMGGYLANQLTCRGKFQAVVAHASGGPYPLDDEADPPSGLFRCVRAPALIMHGKNDTNVLPKEGDTSAARWRMANGCSPVPERDSNPSCVHYTKCAKPVGLCVFPDLGHWVVGDAGARTWSFFEAYKP
jgi:poly(3-hydroxybutyrate) depolymerase